MNFTPLKDFSDEDLRSVYLAGMTYTLRARKPDPAVKGDNGTPLGETLLAKKVSQWVEEGKVRLGVAVVAATDSPGAAAVRVRGTGTVETISVADVGKLKI